MYLKFYETILFITNEVLIGYAYLRFIVSDNRPVFIIKTRFETHYIETTATLIKPSP